MIGSVVDNARRGSYVDRDIMFTQSGAFEEISAKKA